MGIAYPRQKVNKNDVSKFYDLLENIIFKHKLTAREIFNVDEFGTSVVPKCVSKIVERGQLVTAAVFFG